MDERLAEIKDLLDRAQELMNEIVGEQSVPEEEGVDIEKKNYLAKPEEERLAIDQKKVMARKPKPEVIEE